MDNKITDNMDDLSKFIERLSPEELEGLSGEVLEELELIGSEPSKLLGEAKPDFRLIKRNFSPDGVRIY